MPAAEVVLGQEGKLWIKNLSSETWSVYTPSGKKREVHPDGSMPAKEGMKINFNANYAAVITSNN